MFKKLLSNLPFNPSLIGEVAFYAKRVKRETAIRRAGLIFIILGMTVQLFAVFSPPELTLATSDNDLVSGGIASSTDAAGHCRRNTRNFATILGYYGIGCSAIDEASTVSLQSTDYNHNLYALGHKAYGKVGETPVTMERETLYLRYLWSWDLRGPSSYKALKIHNDSGQEFYILYNGGNLVSIGLPQTNQTAQLSQTDEPCLYNSDIAADSAGCQPCSQNGETACLEYRKTVRNVTQNVANANGTTAKPGDVLEYTLIVRNQGKAKIEKFVVQENISDVLDYAAVLDARGGKIDDNKNINWDGTTVDHGQSMEHSFTVKIKNPLPETPVSSSDPGHFDLVMTNIYGNSVNVKLPSSVTKTTEVLGRTLPNTGPGASAGMVVALTVFIAYFFARSRLIAKELDCVRSDFSSNGGA